MHVHINTSRKLAKQTCMCVFVCLSQQAPLIFISQSLRHCIFCIMQLSFFKKRNPYSFFKSVSFFFSLCDFIIIIYFIFSRESHIFIITIIIIFQISLFFVIAIVVVVAVCCFKGLSVTHSLISAGYLLQINTE